MLLTAHWGSALKAGTVDYAPRTPKQGRPDGSKCVNDCNTPKGKGWCVAGAAGTAPLCKCLDSWSGPAWDCSERTCPSGLAWFDMPTSATVAHTTLAECSGKGDCKYSTGECTCAAGFTGDGCIRMTCPGGDSTPCNGRGTCVSMREAAAYVDHITWRLPRVNYTQVSGVGPLLCVCRSTEEM